MYVSVHVYERMDAPADVGEPAVAVDAWALGLPQSLASIESLLPAWRRGRRLRAHGGGSSVACIMVAQVVGRSVTPSERARGGVCV